MESDIQVAVHYDDHGLVWAILRQDDVLVFTDTKEEAERLAAAARQTRSALPAGRAA